MTFFLMYKICHNLSDLNFHNSFPIETLVIICNNTTGPFSLSLILNTISSKISLLTVYRMFGINSLKILYLLQAYLVLKSVLKNLTSTVLLHLSTEYYTLFVKSFFSSPIGMLVCVQSTMVLYFQIKNKIMLFKSIQYYLYIISFFALFYNENNYVTF